MKQALILILLPLFIMGCSHNQGRSYLHDNDINNSRKSVKKINLSEFNVALIVKSDPVPIVPDPLVSDPLVLDNQNIIHVMPYMNSLLTTDDAVLNKSRKDLENFYITAKHLRMSNMEEDLEIYAGIVKEYLSKRIDPLLKDKSDSNSLEVRQALAELQYFKAHLLFEIEDIDSACETVSELDSSDQDEINEDIKIISQRFNKINNYDMVMTEFNYMCK